MSRVVVCAGCGTMWTPPKCAWCGNLRNCKVSIESAREIAQRYERMAQRFQDDSIKETTPWELDAIFPIDLSTQKLRKRETPDKK